MLAPLTVGRGPKTLRLRLICTECGSDTGQSWSGHADGLSEGAQCQLDGRSPAVTERQRPELHDVLPACILPSRATALEAELKEALTGPTAPPRRCTQPPIHANRGERSCSVSLKHPLFLRRLPANQLPPNIPAPTKTGLGAQRISFAIIVHHGANCNCSCRECGSDSWTILVRPRGRPF